MFRTYVVVTTTLSDPPVESRHFTLAGAVNRLEDRWASLADGTIAMILHETPWNVDLVYVDEKGARA